MNRSDAATWHYHSRKVVRSWCRALSSAKLSGDQGLLGGPTTWSRSKECSTPVSEEGGAGMRSQWKILVSLPHGTQATQSFHFIGSTITPIRVIKLNFLMILNPQLPLIKELLEANGWKLTASFAKRSECIQQPPVKDPRSLKENMKLWHLLEVSLYSWPFRGVCPRRRKV